MYRARSGEVLIHKSHADKLGPQEIHSEPNPCPDRHFWAFDWTNILHGVDAETGKQIKSEPVPVDFISEVMQPLSDAHAKPYQSRLLEVKSVVDSLASGGNGYEASLDTTSCEQTLENIIPKGEGTRILEELGRFIEWELGRF